jgi:hypothetical protein
MAAAAVPSAAVVVPTDADIDVPVRIDVPVHVPIHVSVHVSVHVPVLIPVRVSVDVVARVAGFSGMVLSAMGGGVVCSTMSRGVVRPAMTCGVVPPSVTSTMSSTVSAASGERDTRDDEQGRCCGDDRKLVAHGTVSSMLNPMRHLKSSPAEPKMNGKLNIGNRSELRR